METLSTSVVVSAAESTTEAICQFPPHTFADWTGKLGCVWIGAPTTLEDCLKHFQGLDQEGRANDDKTWLTIRFLAILARALVFQSSALAAITSGQRTIDPKYVMADGRLVGVQTKFQMPGLDPEMVSVVESNLKVIMEAYAQNLKNSAGSDGFRSLFTNCIPTSLREAHVTFPSIFQCDLSLAMGRLATEFRDVLATEVDDGVLRSLKSRQWAVPSPSVASGEPFIVYTSEPGAGDLFPACDFSHVADQDWLFHSFQFVLRWLIYALLRSLDNKAGAALKAMSRLLDPRFPVNRDEALGIKRAFRQASPKDLEVKGVLSWDNIFPNGTESSSREIGRAHV